MHKIGALLVALALPLAALAYGPPTARAEPSPVIGERPEAPPGWRAELRQGPHGGFWVLVRDPTPSPAAEPPSVARTPPAVHAPSGAGLPLPDAPDEDAPSEPAFDSGMLAREIVDAINEYRTVADLPPLQPHPLLDAVALGHSEDMAQAGYVGHASPTAGREAITDRLALGGVTRFGKVGENVQRGPQAPDFVGMRVVAEEFARAWMDSEGHRHNIEDGDYVYTGVGVYVGADGIYATQVFTAEVDGASPVPSAPPAPAPTPEQDGWGTTI